MRSRHTTAIVALALSAAALMVSVGAQQRVSAPGAYAGYSPRLYETSQRTSFYVPVRDGTRLAIDLYRPLKDGTPAATRYPVVWMFTPYQRGIRMPDGSVRPTGGSYLEAPDLTLYGYVVAVVDTRGKGASFGWRRGMQDSTEAFDAYDVTEWFARQPWSDGQVGMMGCSYVGGTQDNTASTTPPSLKAIFPGATSFNRYDFVSRGGLTAQFHTRPEDPRDLGVDAMPVDDDRDGSLLAAARKEHERNSIMADIWKDIPFRDDWSKGLRSRYWEESSLSTNRNAVEMRGPVMYRWTGWRDEFSADQFVARANLRNVVKTFIGPEGHCQSTAFNMLDEHLRFFDHYLKGIDNGIEREPSIYYYTYNAPAGREWAVSDVWPIAGTTMARYYLAADAKGALSLGTVKPPTGKASIVTDFSVVTGSDATLLWPVSQYGHGFSFETQPFAQDVRITGHPVVSLWVSTTAADGDTFAYLEEVAPDGKSALRSHGRLRASHRKLGTAPYNYLGLPWHRSFREDYQPMVPGVPAELTFDLLPTSTIVKNGWKLRLVVTGADPRQRTHLDLSPAPTVTLHTGGDKASYVDIPVVPIEPIASRKAAETPNEPSVKGPIPVSAASPMLGAEDVPGAPPGIDLAAHGYLEEEYFVSGTASIYGYDPQWNRVLKRANVPYTTRMILRRPKDPSKFSGNIQFECAHPQRSGTSNWNGTKAYIVRHGDAYVNLMCGADLPTRQVPADQQPTAAPWLLKWFDAARYAPIDWPADDGVRWDVMAQVGALLKGHSRANPLAAYRVERMYAAGWSFTGSLWRTYVNEGFPDQYRMPDGTPIFDGYLYGISASAVRGGYDPINNDENLPLDTPRRFTKTIDVPIIEQMSQNEAPTNVGPEPAEGDRAQGGFRLYEVPGLSHGDGLGNRDNGQTHQLRQRGYTSQPPTPLNCDLEPSDVPMGDLAAAALFNLDAWVRRGIAPPRAPRMTIEASGKTVKADALGNAEGGVRTTQLDVPLAKYGDYGEESNPACRGASPYARIKRVPLTPQQLETLYTGKADYLSKFKAKLDEMVRQRWLLQPEADKELDAARVRADAAFRRPAR